MIKKIFYDTKTILFNTWFNLRCFVVKHFDTTTPMNYRAKLIQFNSTEKYKKEMEFLSELMDLERSDKVLDFGCGIGTFRNYLTDTTRADVRGYDKICYLEDEPEWFNKSFYFEFDVVYFMHSIAHIENLKYELDNLKDFLRAGSEIYVLTPNLDWMRRLNNGSYRPDPTVVAHFNANSLVKVFTDSGYKVEFVGQIGQYYQGLQERIFLKAVYQ
jgi:2-polyprenyl-3-methyl-5-hydroxy-6-metoxy-1,4-benzoquinol methylase